MVATQAQMLKAAERMAAVARESDPNGEFTAEDYIDRIQTDPDDYIQPEDCL